MRFLLLLCLFCICWNSNAQPDSDLFQTWYLSSVEVSDGPPGFFVDNIAPTITPTLTIYPNYDFEGVGACNTFNGSFNFTFPDGGIETAQFTSTFDDCAFEIHNGFEDEYFEFFQWLIGYSIIENDLGYALYMYTGVFGSAIFYNYPLDVSQNNQNKFNIFPNPTSSNLFISQNEVNIQKIEIVTMTGITAKTISTPKQEIDLTSLPKGMYLIKIYSNNGLTIKKILKN